MESSTGKDATFDARDTGDWPDEVTVTEYDNPACIMGTLLGGAGGRGDCRPKNPGPGMKVALPGRGTLDESSDLGSAGAAGSTENVGGDMTAMVDGLAMSTTSPGCGGGGGSGRKLVVFGDGRMGIGG